MPPPLFFFLLSGAHVKQKADENRFHDHQIIESRKDALGTELLSIPFRREELEAILEDLMS